MDSPDPELGKIWGKLAVMYPGVFPSDNSLEKMLYLASGNVVKKWTQRYRNWDQVLNQMIALYGDRLIQYL